MKSNIIFVVFFILNMLFQVQAKADQGEESRLHYMPGNTSNGGDRCEFVVTRDNDENIKSLRLTVFTTAINEKGETYEKVDDEVIRNYSAKDKVSLGVFYDWYSGPSQQYSSRSVSVILGHLYCSSQASLGQLSSSNSPCYGFPDEPASCAWYINRFTPPNPVY